MNLPEMTREDELRTEAMCKMMSVRGDPQPLVPDEDEPFCGFRTVIEGRALSPKE